MPRTSFATLLLLLGLGMTGCTRFSKAWNQAATPSPNNLEGKWEGTWHSEANGHKDKLQCILRRKDQGVYEAWFRAKYYKLLTFTHHAVFQGEETNHQFTYTGEADLGWLAGGLFRYEGKIDSENFFCRYKSKRDHGTFRLQPAR